MIKDRYIRYNVNTDVISRIINNNLNKGTKDGQRLEYIFDQAILTTDKISRNKNERNYCYLKY